MSNITFQGATYQCEADETLLEAMNRQGVKLPYGCRAGVCQACMLKAVSGTPSEDAQSGIEKKLQRKGYFLSCLCNPSSDMEVELPDPMDRYHASQVFDKSMLNASVLRLRCSRPEGFLYRPGQFVNLLKPGAGLVRSYSIASTPDDNFIEFHIRLLADGRMSSWIANDIDNGTFIFISDAMGNCCYNNNDAEHPLLLAGTGTGLAPLYGILRDALASGHRQHIQLLHGGLDCEGLYYQPELQLLAQQYDNFSYLPCVLHGEAPAAGIQGAIDAHFAQFVGSRQNWRIFLCGDSEMVNTLRKICIGHGINESDIHIDGFG